MSDTIRGTSESSGSEMESSGSSACFLAGGWCGVGDAGRFFRVGTVVSGGKRPRSTDMAIALGMDSQDLPFGAIHFLFFRFYVRNASIMERGEVLLDMPVDVNCSIRYCCVISMHSCTTPLRCAKVNFKLTRSNLTVHVSGRPFILASLSALASSAS